MRHLYETTRRAYRASCRVSLLQPGAIEARTAALRALQAVTGKLEDCRPAPMHYQQSENRAGVYRWHVWAACTRFLRNH